MTFAPRALPLAALVLVLAAAEPSRGEIYRWTDAEGRLHFTGSLDQVPPDQREAARRAAETPSTDAPRVHRYSGAASAPPGRAARAGQGDEIEIRFARLGTLMRVDATVNDLVRVPFLIDTGASGVSIPSAYAEKLGVRIRPDTPHVQVTTANGVVPRPLIPLRSVEVDGARVENLMAVVDPSLEFGLLGGAFFNNYVYRVDAARSVITLAPNQDIRGGLSQQEWREQFHKLTEPLERLQEYLREHPQLGAGDRAALAAHQQQLEQGLAELEHQADALGVPQIWRD
jgi:clan AA aspartic protease (TIGR02281 family)